jgi:hypothetical protein
MSQKDGYPSSVATEGGGTGSIPTAGYQDSVWPDKFSASGEKDCGRRSERREPGRDLWLEELDLGSRPSFVRFA